MKKKKDKEDAPKRPVSGRMLGAEVDGELAVVHVAGMVGPVIHRHVFEGISAAAAVRG